MPRHAFLWFGSYKSSAKTLKGTVEPRQCDCRIITVEHTQRIIYRLSCNIYLRIIAADPITRSNHTTYKTAVYVSYTPTPMCMKLKKWYHSKKNALYDSNIISGNNSRILGDTKNVMPPVLSVLTCLNLQ